MEDKQISLTQVILYSILLILIGTFWDIVKYTSYVYTLSGWFYFIFGIGNIEFGTSLKCGVILTVFRIFIIILRMI